MRTKKNRPHTKRSKNVPAASPPPPPPAAKAGRCNLTHAPQKHQPPAFHSHEKISKRSSFEKLTNTHPQPIPLAVYKYIFPEPACRSFPSIDRPIIFKAPPCPSRESPPLRHLSLDNQPRTTASPFLKQTIAAKYLAPTNQPETDRPRREKQQTTKTAAQICTQTKRTLSSKSTKAVTTLQASSTSVSQPQSFDPIPSHSEANRADYLPYTSNKP